jgi:hypothetical protein
MKKSIFAYRYTQRASERLPALALRVDHIPMPDGDRPAGISVRDGTQVIGTLTMKDLADALALYERSMALC